MVLTTDDRQQICEVIALFGHLADADAYDRFDEVFTGDMVIDATDVGLSRPPELDRTTDPSRSLDGYIAAGRRRGSGNTVAMHTTNVVVREDGHGAIASSKGLTVDSFGSCASYRYEDRLVRTGEGWRIQHRVVTAQSADSRGSVVGGGTGFS